MGIEITDVRLLKADDSNNKYEVARGSFVINESFAVKIKIIEKKDGGVFLSFPSYKSVNKSTGEDEWVDMAYPINKETHAMIKEEVLAKYKSLE